MVKWLVRIGVVLALLVGAAFLFREQLLTWVIASRFKPAGAFEASAMPPAPDYGDPQSWAALPGERDLADFAPDGAQAGPAFKGVAVFFVHPTTYLAKAGWNAPYDDADAAAFTDEFVLKGQASAFNACCLVYAPRYRQAAFWSFMDETGSGEAAREAAYEDVARAFDEFIKAIGQAPFIIAGHSQGGEHARRLIERKISGTSLAARMVAAYPVGFYIDPDELAETAPDIPMCAAPAQTGCYATWNSMGEGAQVWRSAREAARAAACVNPLSWRADAAPVAAADNPGSLASASERFEAGVTGAQCVEDRLLVGPFRSDLFDDPPFNMGPENHHLYDYALFWASIRANALQRAEAWQAVQPPGE